MEKYYVNHNSQVNGDHEVHKESCMYVPYIVSKKDLGYHFSCFDAVTEAKKTYPQSNGCAICSPSCHTR